MFKLIDKKLLLTPVSGIGGKRYGQFQTKLEKGEKDFTLSVSSIISDMFGQNVGERQICACLFIRAQRVINK